MSLKQKLFFVSQIKKLRTLQNFRKATNKDSKNKSGDNNVSVLYLFIIY